MAHYSDSEIERYGLTCSFEDVFGKRDEIGMLLDEDDMGWVVANGKRIEPDTCPIFGDEVPYKSCTVVFPKEHRASVEHWLMYVHGGASISGVKDLGDQWAVRSDYMCW